MAYIFVDFDHTLYDHNKKTIHKEDMDALIQAKEKGHTLFLSTGRPYIYLSNDVFKGGIFSCGAKVTIKEKTIFLKTFDPDEVKLLVESLLSMKIDFTVDSDTQRFLTPFAMEIFNKRCQSNELEDCEFNLFKEQKRTSHPIEQIDYNSVLKISLYAKDYDVVKEFVNQLPSKYRTILNPNKKDNFIGGEIAFSTINKSTGLNKILDYYNNPNVQTIAIGDSKNDIEILQEANIGVCMGNGNDQAKQAADFITKSIDSHGVAYALKALHLI